jgi:hypothetical protein
MPHTLTAQDEGEVDEGTAQAPLEPRARVSLTERMVT